ncbi:MAG: hypothetical protein AAF449_23065, partial [Myxococcota bacterium]
MLAEQRTNADYVAFELHKQCPSRSRGARRRPAPAGAKPFGDPVGLSYYGARYRLTDASLVAVLREVASKISPHVKPQVLREALASATTFGADSEHIEAVHRVTTSKVFVSASLTEQLAILRSFARTVMAPPAREALLRALASPILSASTGRPRSEALAYIQGPVVNVYAHPSRGTQFCLHWSRRVRGFVNALNASGSANEQIDAFLGSPSKPFCILTTPIDANLTIYVFGAPDRASSLSYGRIVELDNGYYGASVVSPDPRIRCGWSGPDIRCRVVYQCRTATLTPKEELSMIRWVESNHVVAPRANVR